MKKSTLVIAGTVSAQSIGLSEALKKANRTDVVVCAAGNSTQGMDLVKEGKNFTITYLPQQIITPANVAGFYPAQWYRVPFLTEIKKWLSSRAVIFIQPNLSRGTK